MPDKPRRPWYRRLVRGALWMSVVLIVGLLITRYVIRGRGQTRLSEQVAALDVAEPRWRWDAIEADRPRVPDEENSAILLGGRVAVLVDPKGGIIDWPTDKVPPPNVTRTDAEIAEVTEILERYGHGLKEAKGCADKPRGRFSIDFPPDDAFPRTGHLTVVRNAVRLLDMDTELRTPSNSPAELRANLRAMLNVGASLDGEPILISQLNRIGILTTVVRRIERTLPLGYSPGELPELRGTLTAEARTDFFTSGVRGDRAAMNRFLDRIDAGQPPLSAWVRARDLIASSSASAGPAPPPDFGTRAAIWALPGTFLHGNASRYFELTTQALKATDLPEPEQRAALPQVPPGFELDLVLYRVSRSQSGIEGLLSAQLRIRALLRCAVVALAIEEPRTKHGFWPGTLEDIPKDLLPTVPPDPFTGKPLKYLAGPEGVTVYSVGLNGRDDGGEAGKGRYDSDTRDDIAFRLFRPDLRGVRVVPQGAGPGPGR